eukprot:2764743-Prymnesium_polylepis.1
MLPVHTQTSTHSIPAILVQRLLPQRLELLLARTRLERVLEAGEGRRPRLLLLGGLLLLHLCPQLVLQRHRHDNPLHSIGRGRGRGRRGRGLPLRKVLDRDVLLGHLRHARRQHATVHLRRPAAGQVGERVCLCGLPLLSPTPSLAPDLAACGDAP